MELNFLALKWSSLILFGLFINYFKSARLEEIKFGSESPIRYRYLT
jgi:hypothetical protein